MSSSMSCQLASVADGNKSGEPQSVAESQKKRGERNRELDPLLARVLGRLRQHMADEGISQNSLAEKTGLKQGHISKLIRGESPEASFYLIAKLALAAGVSIDWLVESAPSPVVRSVPSAKAPPKTA
jgi:ribosome-binding protein aMBF1 (putative translation factor)